MLCSLLLIQFFCWECIYNNFIYFLVMIFLNIKFRGGHLGKLSLAQTKLIFCIFFFFLWFSASGFCLLVLLFGFSVFRFWFYYIFKVINKVYALKKIPHIYLFKFQSPLLYLVVIKFSSKVTMISGMITLYLVFSFPTWNEGKLWGPLSACTWLFVWVCISVSQLFHSAMKAVTSFANVFVLYWKAY